MGRTPCSSPTSTWGGPEATLRLRPFPHFRGLEQPLTEEAGLPGVWLEGDRLEVHASGQATPLRMRLLYTGCRTPFVGLSTESPRLLYRQERARGYAHTERLISPGYFECCLTEGRTLALAVSTEGWEAVDRDPLEAFVQERQREDRLLDRAPPEARTGSLGRLVLAADQFLRMSGRTLPRAGERNLRCRAALSRAGLCRTGVERGRAAQRAAPPGREVASMTTTDVGQSDGGVFNCYTAKVAATESDVARAGPRVP